MTNTMPTRISRPTDAQRRKPLVAVAACLFGALALVLISVPRPAEAASRIKDIADFEGVRENLLVGYGLVVGLKGTGDDLGKAPFTQQSLIGMLERLGVNTRDNLANLDTDNVAAVMVTATLPAFARMGSRIDVTVSALGDASDLLGGTLLVTPLLGADGEVYAVSQGSVATGAFTASGAAETVSKGVPTSGRISSGAIVERELGFELASLRSIKIALRNPDFTTSSRIAAVINKQLGGQTARALDQATVLLNLPRGNGPKSAIVEIITEIEQLPVEPDQIAKVVIDEQSGIIVMGEAVRISTVAIAQGNLTIRITETPQVSQPNAFSTTGTTVTVPRTNIEVDEEDKNRVSVLPAGVSLQELVDGVNALGIGPRDLITILQTVKAAGALQAEIEVR